MTEIHLTVIPPVRQDEPAPVRRLLDRSRLAQIIAQQLYSAYCREHDLKLLRLQDAPPKEAQPFRDAGEMVVQMALQPDLEQTAVMAMAEVICLDSASLTIFELSRRAQQHYLQVAQSAIDAYRATLRLRALDPRGDNRLCRLVDALARPTYAEIYEDETRLIICDNCDREVNVEDSTHVPPDSCTGEGRVCYVCAHNDALWQQHGLPQPSWEKGGKS
jgi:hypothetical protein